MNGPDEYPGMKRMLEERAELMRIAAVSCLDRQHLDPHTKAWALRMAATKPLNRPLSSGEPIRLIPIREEVPA